MSAHLLCAAIISSTFWHNLMAQTSIRVIASAGSVSVVVQIIKVVAPQWICGRRVIAVNLATSIAAVFIGMDPSHFWTQATLAEILSVAGLATGVHSNTKTLLGQPIGVAAWPSAILRAQGQSSNPYLPQIKTGGDLEE